MNKPAQSAEEWNHVGTVCFTQGQFEEAARAYQAAIDIRADYVDAYYNLGLAFNKLKQREPAYLAFMALITLVPQHVGGRFQLGCIFMQRADYKSAIEHFSVIEKLDPTHFETMVNMGSCYLRNGLLYEAKARYLRALEISPEDIQVLFNLGVISAQQGRLQEALTYYGQALKISPNFFDAHNNIGVVYLNLQDHDAALLHFRAALALQPSNEAVRHLVNVLAQTKNMTYSPPEYIQSLFDAYADHYDVHLLGPLHYQVPDYMWEMVSAVRNVTANQSAWRILDVGCGTGLSGARFKPIASTLVGVDLSQNMLALAAQKQLYDQLIHAEIVSFLADKHAAYDLIIGGDVLVYFGVLEDVFRAVSSALVPQGYFIFNTEITETADFRMLGSGRFAHRRAYLERLAAEYGMTVVRYQSVSLRTQAEQSIAGHLYLMQKQA